MPKSPEARLYPTGSISSHARLQVRGGTNPTDVRRYAKDMLAGDTFPPITLAESGGKLYVIDGHHRLEAARTAGLPSIAGTQRRMSLGDAQREALSALSRHDRSPTAKEKQHAFASYIAEGLHLDSAANVKSLRTIAAECPVYVFQHVSRKLKEMGIDAPRDDVVHYRHAGNDDGPSQQDLEEEQEIQHSAFCAHLAAAAQVYGILSDDGRKSALVALSDLQNSLKPPLGYLEI